MRRRRVVLIVLLGLTLAVAIGVGLWNSGARSGGLVRRLPDGSTLTLEAITYGREHRVVHGTWWQKLLLRSAPRRLEWELGRRFGCVTAEHVTPRPETLVFWTYLREVGKSALWRDRARTRVVAVDEHGCERRMTTRHFRTWSSWWSPHSTAPDEALFAWEVPAYSRRGRRITVRIEHRAERGRWVTAGEFDLPNPARGPFPTWTAPPLPATARDGDLAVTLAGLATGLEAGDLRRTVGPGVWTRASFRCVRNGRPAPEWEPVEATLADATGNVWTLPDRFADRAGDAVRLCWAGALCPAEAAWKLRVRLARISGFALDELWTVRDFPATDFFQSAPAAATARRQGVTLRLNHVVRLARLPTPNPPGWSPYRSQVDLEVAPDWPDLQVTLLRATDEQGRTLEPRPRREGTGQYAYGLYGPAPVQRVNLTFAVQRVRVVEFLAKPSLYGPAAFGSAKR